MAKQTISSKTPGGIKRPRTGQIATFRAARTVAKVRNVENGRGHRALKTLDGNYAIIFRPAVANNKQRRVRSLDAR